MSSQGSTHVRLLDKYQLATIKPKLICVLTLNGMPNAQAIKNKLA